MNKKIIMLLSIFLIVFTVSTVCAGDNQTDSNLTSPTSVVVAGDSFDDIQNAVKNASDNDLIQLEGNYYSNRKAINIDKSVTIQGSANGTVLNAKKLSKVFVIKADNVVLKDLTIENSYGSAILSEYSGGKYNLNIINCTFKNNLEENDGGIIFHTNYGNLTVINSTFENNEADYGGAIYSVSNVKVINSIFTSNIATYSGGAIHCWGDTLYVSGCQFNNNRASKESKGGAIFTECYSSQIVNSTFNGNKASFGGAIWGQDNVTVENSNFTSNSAKEKAGAIYASSELDDKGNIQSCISISGSRFTSNTAANVSCVYIKLSDADISNSHFGDNQEVYIKFGTLKNTNSTLKNVKRDNKVRLIVKPAKFTTTYDSFEYMKVFVTDDEGDEIGTMKIKISVTVGKKTKTFYGYTDLDDYFLFVELSRLPVGKYSAKFSVDEKDFKSDTVKKTITIKKADTIVKAPKVTAKYKKSKMFTIKVKNKATHYNVKNLKLKVKIYTGKKAKKYTVKTNKKGVASISTKKLKRGVHKVVITSKNKNYAVDKKSKIIIK